MKIKATSGATLFLIEFIIIVFVLVLAVGVAAGFFMKSRETAEHSRDLVSGTLIAQTVAEEIKSGLDPAAVSAYSADGLPDQEGIFIAKVTKKMEERNVVAYRISVFKDDTRICFLPLKRYREEVTAE